MKKIIFGLFSMITVSFQGSYAQDCKTNADLDVTPGKYITAAEYPWPAARAEYFINLTTGKDKALAKQIAGQIEKADQQSHMGFKLTGGNWENIYSSKGYAYIGKIKLAQYRFEAMLHEFFCLNGKLKRNDEAGTILRIYVNDIPTNTLDRFLQLPFGSSMGDYDFGYQYRDWKNHKPADVNAQLISLFTYFSCNNEQLLKAINSGKGYFQDVPEKDIKPDNRSNLIYRYWFVTKKDSPVLIPVSRKEYLESLLDYYEREKLYFPKLADKLTKDHDKGVTQYGSWETDVADKIAVVKKALNEHDTNWLTTQAVINRSEDGARTYKAGLKERTNYNRFWGFYDKQSKSNPLYQHNADYFKRNAQGPAKPQLITVAFRYVSMPAPLRIVKNFTHNFDFILLQKLLE